MGRRRSNEWEGWQATASTGVSLMPIFGCQPFTPKTTCADIHPGGDIPRGSSCCCMACNKSGKDHLPLLGETPGSRMNPGWETTPIAHPEPYIPPAKRAKESRKDRRARERAEREAQS